MKILIAGGRGFLGSALRQSLLSSGHEVWVLTRRAQRDESEIAWDGQTEQGWSQKLNDVDAVVNVTGYGLEHWPWTRRQKQRFIDSRLAPSAALVQGISKARHKPSVFLQISGINYYGVRGAGIADERSPAADDFLAQLCVQWEAASQPVERWTRTVDFSR
jgi:NAD dependent epimerase/dehydratase family enzyme